MNNVAINKNVWLYRFLCTAKTKEKDQTTNIEKSISINTKTKNNILKNSIANIDSTTFFENFNSILASPTKTPENSIQKDIQTLITNQGYDKGITASASLAIIYHLINISKKVDCDILEDNKINYTKLECYLNLFMNLSDSNIKQIINYAKQIELSLIEPSPQLNLSLNSYSMLMPEVSDKAKATPSLANFNTQVLINASSQESSCYQNIITQLKKIENHDKNRLNLLSDIIEAHSKNQIEMDDIVNRTNEANTKVKEWQTLIKEIEKKLNDATNVKINKPIQEEKEVETYKNKLQQAIANEKEARQKLMALGNNIQWQVMVAAQDTLDNAKKKLFIAKKKLHIAETALRSIQTRIKEKEQLISSYNKKLSDAHEALKAAKYRCSNTYQRVLKKLEERGENIVNKKSPTVLAYLQNGYQLVECLKSLPSAFNKLDSDQQDQIILDVKKNIYTRNNSEDNSLEEIKNWPINTYQLINKNGTVLQTFTGALFDKKINSNSHSKRLNAVLKLAGATNPQNSEICISRMLDNWKDGNKIKSDKRETEAAVEAAGYAITYRHGPFSAGFWHHKYGTGQDINNDKVANRHRKATFHHLIGEKLKEEPNKKANLISITAQYFKLKKIENMTSTQFTLYNTLHNILKNAIPEFNSFLIMGCKSAKDRTSSEISTECALQTMIEESLDKEPEEFNKLNLEALVANNKININALSEAQIKTFINNFDDTIFYMVNKHDNNFFSNVNAVTHLNMLSDFTYHNKFKVPYKRISAGS